jgi:hypothetical protein
MLLGAQTCYIKGTFPFVSESILGMFHYTYTSHIQEKPSLKTYTCSLELMYLPRITCQTSNRFYLQIQHKTKHSGISSYPRCCDKSKDRGAGYLIPVIN